jgi:uncharacterized membrane protein YbjE (DUF340 family)
MFIVILFLFSGMLIGFLLNRNVKIIKISGKLSTWFIYVFLFLLGISVGSSEEIMRNFVKIGVQAIIITVGAISGSVLASYFIFKRFFKEKE